MGLGVYAIDTGAVWGGKLTAMELGPELRLHQVAGRDPPDGIPRGDD
jgi:bis(5'-nucleosyl)-tetraphosphatase (symmetrical)